MALKKAYEHDIDNYRHVSVLVKGGRLIGVGVNKNKSGALIDPLYRDKGVHSEAAILCQFNPEELKGATLYVVGVSPGGFIANSKPCPLCMKFIKKYHSLKSVFYCDRGEVKRL
jgi:tRNA(Arg) A34 adenosine deaminase TadA